MARTFINPLTQIGNSTEYDDTLPASADLQNNAESLQDDLNALRSMLKSAVQQQLTTVTNEPGSHSQRHADRYRS